MTVSMKINPGSGAKNAVGDDIISQVPAICDLFKHATGIENVDGKVTLVISPAVKRASSEKFTADIEILEACMAKTMAWMNRMSVESWPAMEMLGGMLYFLRVLIDLLKIYKDSGNKIEKIRTIKDVVDQCRYLLEELQKIYKRGVLSDICSCLDGIERKCRLKGGEHDPVKKVLILYKNVLGDFEQNRTGWLQTFAHEMFHVLHYAAADRLILAGGGSNGTIVQESLADAFTYMYCRMQCYRDLADSLVWVQNANTLLNEWRSENLYYCPYAGAKYLVDEGTDVQSDGTVHRATLFAKTFEKSLKDIDAAYEIIVKKKMIDF